MNAELESIFPPIFDGAKGAASRWFNRVQLHFFVSQRSDPTATMDPLRKIGLTLGWMRGSRVDYWVDRQIGWLTDQENGPNAVADPWVVFRQAFFETFSYPSEVRRATADLNQLKMKDGNVDEYIATFANLAGLAQLTLDSPSTLRMFEGGLVMTPLECLQAGLVRPNTFMEWCQLARHYQANSDSLISLWANKDASNNAKAKAFGMRNRGNSQQTQVSMATSRRRKGKVNTNIKCGAATGEDKAKYRAEGLCFCCGEQGHIARNCVSRKSHVSVAQVDLAFLK